MPKAPATTIASGLSQSHSPALSAILRPRNSHCEPKTIGPERAPPRQTATRARTTLPVSSVSKALRAGKNTTEKAIA